MSELTLFINRLKFIKRSHQLKVGTEKYVEKIEKIIRGDIELATFLTDPDWRIREFTEEYLKLKEKE